MRLTVIPSDNIIIKDGQRLVFEFVAPADLHAIQWYGAHGFVETTDGKQVRIDSLTSVQAYIDAYAAEVERLAVIAATPPPPAPIPTSVTMRQARLALLNAGLLTSVNATLASMAGTAGEAARIEWEYAMSVERNNPLVSGLSAALNLTPAQLDQLFTTAKTL